MLERLFLRMAPISALFGAAAFIVATLYLAVERCAGSCTGFLEGMNRAPSLSHSGAVIVGLVLALACVGRHGRGFAGGFLAAFVICGILTSGDTLFLWGVPNQPWHRVAQGRGDRRSERLHELRTRPLDERLGGELVYRVLDCVGDGRPSLPIEIATGSCRDLRASWEGHAGPERLSAADSGWRWAYTRTTAGFRVAVYPDAMLNQLTPQFAADETGRITVRRDDGAPAAEYPRR
jgi:hypothetical protein